MTEDILKTYLKVLYFINNRLRHKFINSIKATDYQKHRINMDLEILKRNIEIEMILESLDSYLKDLPFNQEFCILDTNEGLDYLYE